MNPTAKIRILGVDFRVSRLPIEEEAGHSNICLRTINVDPTKPSCVQQETICHEVVHNMIGLMGLSHLLGDKAEEAVAQGLGFALYRFMVENPALVAQLSRREPA